MAKSIYVGVNGASRKVKKAYLGVDGNARKVKKAYLGINGIARLIFSAGLSEVNPFGTNAMNASGYVNGYYYIFESGPLMNSSGRLAYSTNGQNWSVINMPMATGNADGVSGVIYWSDLVYNSSKYIALGSSTSGHAIIGYADNLGGPWEAECPYGSRSYPHYFAPNCTNNGIEEAAKFSRNTSYLGFQPRAAGYAYYILYLYRGNSVATSDWEVSEHMGGDGSTSTAPVTILKRSYDGDTIIDRVGVHIETGGFGSSRKSSSYSVGIFPWDCCEGTDNYDIFTPQYGNIIYRSESFGLSGYNSMQVEIPNFSGSRISAARSVNGQAILVSFNGTEMNFYTANSPYTSWSRHVITLPYEVDLYLSIDYTPNGFVLTYRDGGGGLRTFVYAQ